MSTLHVVFGAGPLGRATASALARRGRAVRVVHRSGTAAGFPAGVEVAAGDATDADRAAGLCRGAAAVYQCAQPPYHTWPERFPALQAAVVAAARSADARLVVADNLYLYGEPDGPMDEAHPASATTRKGAVRARMAEALVEAHERGKVEVAVGRGSDFFGPHVLESALGARVFGPVARGRTAAVPGDPDRPRSYTFVDDFGEALAVLGERSGAAGRAWHVPCLPATTTRALVGRAFEIAGHAPRLRAEGRTATRLAGLFVPAARETVEMLYAFERPFVVVDRAYRAAFGGTNTLADEALRRTVAWYQDRDAA